MTVEPSTLCQVITPDVLPDDLLEGKRVENMTTANLVNRAPNSDIQERSIP